MPSIKNLKSNKYSKKISVKNELPNSAKIKAILSKRKVTVQPILPSISSCRTSRHSSNKLQNINFKIKKPVSRYQEFSKKYTIEEETKQSWQMFDEPQKNKIKYSKKYIQSQSSFKRKMSLNLESLHFQKIQKSSDYSNLQNEIKACKQNLQIELKRQNTQRITIRKQLINQQNIRKIPACKFVVNPFAKKPKISKFILNNNDFFKEKPNLQSSFGLNVSQVMDLNDISQIAQQKNQCQKFMEVQSYQILNLGS